MAWSVAESAAVEGTESLIALSGAANAKSNSCLYISEKELLCLSPQSVCRHFIALRPIWELLPEPWERVKNFL